MEGSTAQAAASAATAAAEAASAAAAAATAAATAAAAAAAAMSQAGSVAATTPGSTAGASVGPFRSALPPPPAVTRLTSLSLPQPFLNPKQHKMVRLKQKIMVSPDSCIFRFAVDHPNQVLGLPVGQHMYVKKKGVTGAGKEELVMRAYTPTTGDETPGHFDLLVKIYRANVHPQFPDGGKLSTVSPSFSCVEKAVCMMSSTTMMQRDPWSWNPVYPTVHVWVINQSDRIWRH